MSGHSAIVLEKTTAASHDSSAGPSTRITIRDSWPAVEQISPAWRSWQCDPNADLDFVRYIIGVRQECERPYVVAVEQAGDLKSLLIGRAERVKAILRFGYYKLAQPEIRQISFLDGGLLGSLDESGADQLVRAMQERLDGGDADAAHFPHLRAGSPLAQSLRRIPGLLRRDMTPKTQLHRSMAVPETLDQVYARLSSKVRKNQKWQAKKLLEAFAGAVEVRTYSREQELNDLFRDVDQIASKTYQRGLGVGFADNQEMRGRMQLESSHGWLQAFVLYLGGAPAAFWIGTKYRNVFFSDFMGYDPEHARHSPGMYLIFRGIEHLCGEKGEDRVSTIDFGLGDAQYKQLLGTESWMEESFHLYSGSLRGIALNLSQTLTGTLDRGARAVLRRLRLEDYVKTGWRKRVAARS